MMIKRYFDDDDYDNDYEIDDNDDDEYDIDENN